MLLPYVESVFCAEANSVFIVMHSLLDSRCGITNHEEELQLLRGNLSPVGMGARYPMCSVDQGGCPHKTQSRITRSESQPFAPPPPTRPRPTANRRQPLSGVTFCECSCSPGSPHSSRVSAVLFDSSRRAVSRVCFI